VPDVLEEVPDVTEEVPYNLQDVSDVQQKADNDVTS
jgi:hypothetical protein